MTDYKHKVDKDPDAKLPYGFDYSDWLTDGDTLSDSSWSIERVNGSGASMSVSSSEFTDTIAKATVDGGAKGQQYLLTNSIVTADALEDDRTILVTIKER